MTPEQERVLRDRAHAIMHDFSGHPCRTDGGWCDAKDHADAIVDACLQATAAALRATADARVRREV